MSLSAEPIPATYFSIAISGIRLLAGVYGLVCSASVFFLVGLACGDIEPLDVV